MLTVIPRDPKTGDFLGDSGRGYPGLPIKDEWKAADGKTYYRPTWKDSMYPDYSDWISPKPREEKVPGGPWLQQPFQQPIKDTELVVNHVVDISRHAKITAQGRLFSYSATVVLGNGKGVGGIGYGRGKNPIEAISNATLIAKRSIIVLPRYQFTIPKGFEFTWRGCKVICHTKQKGKGQRGTLLLKRIATAFGIEDITAKIHGSRNPKKVAHTFIRGLIRFAILSPAAIAKYTGRKYVDWNNTWQARPPAEDQTNNDLQNYETPMPPQPKYPVRDQVNISDEYEIMETLRPSKVPRNMFYKTQAEWE